MHKPDIVLWTGEANTAKRPGEPEYIIIHYATTASSRYGVAIDNAIYYNTPGVNASADFFVDDGCIVQKNPDIRGRYTYAVGGRRLLGSKGGKLYGMAANRNSISIEMCSWNDTGKKTPNPNDGHWHVTEAVVEKTVALTRWLMEEFDIPAERVIRHYDVTGKLCPGIVGWNENSGDVSEWLKFKAQLIAPAEPNPMSTLDTKNKESEEENMDLERFKELYAEMRQELQDNDSSPYSEKARKWAKEVGIIQGGDSNSFNGMWEDIPTREQLVTMMYRFAQIIGVVPTPDTGKEGE